MHTPTYEIKSDKVISTWYTLGNADAGGSVTFKPYNSKVFNGKIFYYSV